jgi:hypothetical protein
LEPRNQIGAGLNESEATDHTICYSAPVNFLTNFRIGHDTPATPSW